MISKNRYQINNRRCGITDKAIAKEVKIGQVTFSRWKRERPELYQRIKQSYQCQEMIEKLGITLDEVKEMIEAYQGKG